MEGAQLPWKVQKIDTSRGPPADYSSIKFPLPSPPDDMEWIQNKDTKEWKLVTLIDPKLSQSRETKKINEEDGVRERSCSVSSVESTSSDLFPAGPPVEQYIEHTVLPSDTLQGICLKYKVSVIKLRQVNRFSGSNLLLAPSKLRIPLVDGVVVYRQDVECPEYKIHFLRAELPQMSHAEAKAYLEFAEWNLSAAIAEAKEDVKWEENHRHKCQKGIVGSYLDHKENIRRMHKIEDLMFDDKDVETAVPVMEDSNVAIPKNVSSTKRFSDAAMNFFNRQEESGMEMTSSMMVPLLASDHEMNE